MLGSVFCFTVPHVHVFTVHPISQMVANHHSLCVADFKIGLIGKIDSDLGYGQIDSFSFYKSTKLTKVEIGEVRSKVR